LQLSKDEEEDLSPHLFSFREAMIQIGEREEKVVEQLRELRQVKRQAQLKMPSTY